MKKGLLFLGLLFSGSLAMANQCAFDLLGTDTRDYKDSEGNFVKQIIIPSSCTYFTINLRNVTKMHKTAMGHNVVIAKAKDVKAIALDGAIAGVDLLEVMIWDLSGNGMPQIKASTLVFIGEL